MYMICKFIDYDKNYNWALVGDSHRKNLWILSRSKQLDLTTYNYLLHKSRMQFYDLKDFKKTI